MRALLALCFIFNVATAQASEASAWFEETTNHLASIWKDGNDELYVPLYTYHMPFAYTPEKIADYTSYPMGLGFGKGIVNESGNWEGLFGVAFKDSHGVFEYLAGYGWVPMWNVDKAGDWKVGAGGSAFLMARKDIFNYTPFPGVLPIASVSYQKLSLQTTYIPGGKGFGNVIFTWAKWELDKS